ncbi:hypothetical protein BpHYR1_040741 [Brachionus plicatilis]|uniref:Uncharacterized protein n=1 Tax=Brachionus plicatilis TaxID=10195 RepID=A0A3M7QLT2_BRAPC|nr:hypothetical protein BpHYR1_040741 [Brachionus plicatilis]
MIDYFDFLVKNYYAYFLIEHLIINFNMPEICHFYFHLKLDHPVFHHNPIWPLVLLDYCFFLNYLRGTSGRMTSILKILLIENNFLFALIDRFEAIWDGIPPKLLSCSRTRIHQSFFLVIVGLVGSYINHQPDSPNTKALKEKAKKSKRRI